jgi:uncharacterized protein
MTLLDQIRKDQLQSRKNRNELKTKLLTTLLGDVIAVGKNDGNRETTDAETVAVVKKYVKVLQENLANTMLEGGIVMLWNAELEILKGYLPQQMDVNEIKLALNTAILDGVFAKDIKSKGLAMKFLKDNFAGKYDGKEAAGAVDEVLKG